MCRIDFNDLVKCGIALIALIVYVAFMFMIPINLLYNGVKDDHQKSIWVGLGWLIFSALLTTLIIVAIVVRFYKNKRTYHEYEQLK